MGWELPPTSPTDTNLEHYYHYPGVTLGIHRIHGYQIKYERVLVKHDHVATARFVKIHTINVPKRLTCHDAIYLPVGEETVIVTCPEMDCNGRFVFVTVLFYREASSPADCRCGCTPSSSSSIVTVCRNSACSSVGKSVTTGRRVHFAPLASARYPASCPKEVKEASI